MWCDQAKWRKLELVNTDYKIKPNKSDNFFVSYCFYNLSAACIFVTNWPMSMGML